MCAIIDSSIASSDVSLLLQENSKWVEQKVGTLPDDNLWGVRCQTNRKLAAY